MRKDIWNTYGMISEVNHPNEFLQIKYKNKIWTWRKINCKTKKVTYESICDSDYEGEQLYQRAQCYY